MTPQVAVPFYQVDAFADQPFSGNPAGVCLLDGPLSTELMQAIAAEINLSETAFLQPPDRDGVRPLQWFTPTTEVPLCGHATLATAHALHHEVGEAGPFRFRTLSGLLGVESEGEGWLRMDFPVDPPTPADPPLGLLEALGCEGVEEVVRGVKGWVIRLPSEAHLRELLPNMGALERVDIGHGALGVIVTASGSEGVDFVSRFFGPWVGVPEDPVTGMAHTLLTPYWAGILGRSRFLARQISHRGGTLRVAMSGERVHISGQAVTVVKGSLSPG